VEFEEDTQMLFEKIKLGQFIIVYSDTTEEELLGAPENVQSLLPSINDELKIKVELNQEAVELADEYLAENVVGKTSRTDCFHIAMATIIGVDILVSWNFKHIVNVRRIRGYNAVKFMRNTRDKISSETQNMNFEQLKKYFEERRLKLLK
jgi:hypothetical protein